MIIPHSLLTTEFYFHGSRFNIHRTFAGGRENDAKESFNSTILTSMTPKVG